MSSLKNYKQKSGLNSALMLSKTQKAAYGAGAVAVAFQRGPSGIYPDRLSRGRRLPLRTHTNTDMKESQPLIDEAPREA